MQAFSKKLLVLGTGAPLPVARTLRVTTWVTALASCLSKAYCHLASMPWGAWPVCKSRPDRLLRWTARTWTMPLGWFWQRPCCQPVRIRQSWASSSPMALTRSKKLLFFAQLCTPSKPVVLTCAMRPATALSPDGPQNVLDALCVPDSSAARLGCGCRGGARTVAVRESTSLPHGCVQFRRGWPAGVEEGCLRWLHPAGADALALAPDAPRC